MPVNMKDVSKFKLNSVFFGGVITHKNKLSRGYYGQSKDKFYLMIRASDIPDNVITLIFEEADAVYVAKHFKKGDFITALGHLESNIYVKTQVYIRVTQVAFPVELHIQKIKQEMEDIEYSRSIEEMLDETESESDE